MGVMWLLDKHRRAAGDAFPRWSVGTIAFLWFPRSSVGTYTFIDGLDAPAWEPIRVYK